VALTTSMPLSVVVGRMAEGMSALVLLAVPLFVLFTGGLLPAALAALSLAALVFIRSRQLQLGGMARVSPREPCATAF
jgi:TRAP-type C4-dicarboxylate transport system permease large subunit